MECLFCRIAKHEVPAVILYEDESLLAFLDVAPIREGHTQIIPKVHVETFDVLPPVLVAQMVSLAQRFAQRMKAAYRVDRVAFLFTGGDVPHAHAHVVPLHEKTDITSARYLLAEAPIAWDSAHLMVDIQTLESVKEILAFPERSLEAASVRSV
jgi:histidine triad (HIT) family protein